MGQTTTNNINDDEAKRVEMLIRTLATDFQGRLERETFDAKPPRQRRVQVTRFLKHSGHA